MTLYWIRGVVSKHGQEYARRRENKGSIENETREFIPSLPFQQALHTYANHT